MSAEEKDALKPPLDTHKKRKKRRRRKRNKSHHHEKTTPLLLPHQRNILSKPFHYPVQDEPESPYNRIKSLSKNKLQQQLQNMPLAIVKALYSALGGQPSRISDTERLYQLCSKALKQGSRLNALLKELHHRDKQALCILLHCGGIGHHSSLLEELCISLGGQSSEWEKSMIHLGKKGLICRTTSNNDQFFYVIPPLLLPFLSEELKDDIALPIFDHEDLKIPYQREFEPSLDFSLLTLLTYISQHPLQLTQQARIAKNNKDDLDRFFAQVWDPQSDVFNLHIEILMQNGLVEFKDNGLAVNHSAVDEWLHMNPSEQSRLIFSKIERDFPFIEWLLWVLNQAKGKWIAERPLHALYRRWRKGDVWRDIYNSTQWKTPLENKDTYAFASLISQGILELGTWGSEKFYRVSARFTDLLKNTRTESFQQFYLQPSFDIVAPAGLPARMLYQIGDLAELISCDRLNSYKITEYSISRALKNGWKRDQILHFLKQGSQIGLPDNVEQTVRGWIGTQGDIEFFEATVLTVHRAQIRKFESSRHYKPYVIHRFGPGLYIVDPSKLDQFKSKLDEEGFHLSASEKNLIPTTQSIKTKSALQENLFEANENHRELFEIEQAHDILIDELIPLSLPHKSNRRKKKPLPPRSTPLSTKHICENAIAEHQNLKVMYLTKNNERLLVTLAPERLAVNHLGNQVLVATDQKNQKRLSYNLKQIERIEILST